MNRNRQEKGITLIALVVTIIILLILSGIAITLTIGEQGIISRAQTAKKDYEEATKNEQNDLSKLYGSILVGTSDDSEITINMKELKKLIAEQVDEKLNSQTPVGTTGIGEHSLLMVATNESLNIGKYNLTTFKNTKSETFNNYFSYDENIGELTCEVNGWYYLDFELAVDDSADKVTYNNIDCFINNVRICHLSGIAVEGREQYNNSSTTVFLRKGDKITIQKEVTTANAVSNAKVSVKLFKF